jgi:hypothetical protein
MAADTDADLGQVTGRILISRGRRDHVQVRIQLPPGLKLHKGAIEFIIFTRTPVPSRDTTNMTLFGAFHGSDEIYRLKSAAGGMPPDGLVPRLF